MKISDISGKVVTRIAPSPTGLMHIGTVRTALFNYLFAKQNGGDFILRIEDTDKKRSRKEFEDKIYESFEWLGISWDATYRQSDRVEIYKKYLHKLLDEDKAYVSNEPSTDNPTQQIDVIRLRNPSKKIEFTDLIRGLITFDTSDLGDFVIARNINDPLYHFVVVVDDYEMNISHVLRADEHIANTPRQILIQEALGIPKLCYGHLPLILDAERKKLSKRNGAVSVDDFKAQGYLPEALLNYLALLGWNPGTEQELFTLLELIKIFDLKGIQKAGAIFDLTKLNWFNRHYILKQDHALLASNAAQLLESTHPKLAKIFASAGAAFEDALDRISRLNEIPELADQGEYSFYEQAPLVNTELICRNGKILSADARTNLTEVLTRLSAIGEAVWDRMSISDAVMPYAEVAGKGVVLWPLRTALSGKERSPDPFTMAEAIGKTGTLERIQEALNVIQNV